LFVYESNIFEISICPWVLLLITVDCCWIVELYVY